jgi:hypothetical protein
MRLKLYDDTYQIARLPLGSDVGAGVFGGEFWSVCGTDDELSVVCVESVELAFEKCDKGWRIFKFVESMDLNLIGIAARITTVLAEANVNVMVVSTYNTDFIMVKNEKLEAAKKALIDNVYEIVG